MPSTRRFLCEDEKDDVRECMLAEKRVKKSKYFTKFLDVLFHLDSSSSLYVSTSVKNYTISVC
jgi:hypothetical protein